MISYAVPNIRAHLKDLGNPSLPRASLAFECERNSAWNIFWSRIKNSE